MTNTFRTLVRDTGTVPVSFVAASSESSYVNLGDALSPVMVGLVGGKPIRHVAKNANVPRMSAVGTIAHGFSHGEVFVWGSGASSFRNPFAPAADKIPFVPAADTRYRVFATRGPVTRSLLGEANAVGAPVF